MGLFGGRRPTVSVLRLHGVIGNIGPMRRGLTLAALAGQIERALAFDNLKAIALSINSPGGSPVQSSLIYNRLRQRARERDIPLLVFVEDVAASGGYLLACAGDEIFVDPSSIVGSIGVVSAGFGFVGLMERIGVERRMHTAGTHKGMLDPFRPEKAEDVARLRAIQDDIHGTFKDLVRERRGKRLKAPEDALFNGEVWSGRRAVELGLVDGIGELRSVLRDRFGEKVRLQLVGARQGLLRRMGLMRAPAVPVPEGGFGHEAGTAIADGVIAALEERAYWARYGL